MPSVTTFLDELRRQLGKPYQYGAAGPGAFDCSGLVQYALERAGLKNVPRTSEAQWAWVQRINRGQLRPGDLVFSQWPGDNASPGHVQVYIGGGKVIQAPHSGAKVSIASLSADAGHIIGYGRVPGLSGGPAGGAVTGPAVAQGGSTGGIQTAAAAQAAGGLLTQAGDLFHGLAEILDWVYGFFAPGQGWRLAFGGIAVASGYGAVRTYMSGSGSMGGSAFPLAVGLAGVSTMSAFMALRPWPETGAGPEKPGAYIAEILSGQPPPAGPQRVHEVKTIETGLIIFAAAWLASKAASSLSGIIGMISGVLGGLGLRGGGGGGAPPPPPPGEVPPIPLEG